MATSFRRQRVSILVDPEKKWFEYDLADHKGKPSKRLPVKLVQVLKEKAASLYEKEVENYGQFISKANKRSDHYWVDRLIKMGTSKDKVAGLTLLVQDSPLHNVHALETILKRVDIRGKRECIQAVETLKDVFLNEILPPDRKLRPFDQKPLGDLDQLAAGDPQGSDRLLVVWHFESRAKEIYAAFIDKTVELVQKALDATKVKFIHVVFQMLSRHPEQEQVLLRTLVNKVGDPAHTAASQACRCLSELAEEHPLMRLVIVAEVERLLFRPNVHNRSRYYAVCFLNQVILDNEDGPLASKLIVLYLSLFKLCTQRGVIDTKMLSALLSGVNRAFPFSRSSRHVFTEHLDDLYRIVHAANFNVGIQALTLLFNVCEAEENCSDRFYTAVYRKLVDAEVKHSSKHALFINLLFKMLKKDTMVCRVYAFIKRILQIATEHPPPLMCGFLIMISVVLKKRSLKLLTVEQQEGTSSDGNLFADDDEERFTDAPDDDDGGNDVVPTEPGEGGTAGLRNGDGGAKPEASWVHRRNLEGVLGGAKAGARSTTYDPLHRNPLFAHADRSSVWELLKLARCYHPSVALFARDVIAGTPINYSGDPLQDFTQMRFLDRFVFRSPKSVPAVDKPQQSVLGKRSRYVPHGPRRVPVNSEMYVGQPATEVPVEERFLYNFLLKKKSDTAALDADVDVASVSSEQFVNYISRYEKHFIDGDSGMDFASEVKRKKQSSSQDPGEGGTGDADDDASDSDEVISDNDVEMDDVTEGEGSEDLNEDFADRFQDIDENSEAGDDAEIVGDDVESDDVDGEEEDEDRPLKKMKRWEMDTDFIMDDGKGDNEKAFKRLLSEYNGGHVKKSKVFVTADKFSRMLEKTAASKIDTITSDAIIPRNTKDSVRQIKWEMKRTVEEDHNSTWRPREDFPKKHRGGGGAVAHRKGSKRPTSRTVNAKVQLGGGRGRGGRGRAGRKPEHGRTNEKPPRTATRFGYGMGRIKLK